MVYSVLQTFVDQLGQLPHDLLINGGVAIAIFLATIMVVKRMVSPTSKRDNDSTSSCDKNIDFGSVKSIWDFNRKHYKTSTVKSKDGVPGKPFGSSYYYAHNNPNAKGGYKDGLRMEDYTMNQPRLLSRDGKAIDEAKDSDNYDEVEPPPLSTVPERPPQKSNQLSKDPSVKLITKYQWDDPGDLNGIAHIRIDKLPGKGGTDLRWQEITVKDVSAKVIGDGLEVQVQAESGDTYLLKIPVLYGQAATVRAYVKPKRLVIRLWKVKSMFSMMDYGKSNLKPWPQLKKP